MGNEYRHIYPPRYITVNDANPGLTITQSGAGSGLDMVAKEIVNIGHTSTDFSTAGGLTLANDFSTSRAQVGGIVIANVENTDGTNAASHAQLRIRTANGGGDPFILFNAVGATIANWAVGVDRSAGTSQFTISPSTVLGGTNRIQIEGAVSGTSIYRTVSIRSAATTVTVSASAVHKMLDLAVDSLTITYSSQTQITSAWNIVDFDIPYTLTGSAGAVIIDRISMMAVRPPVMGANFTGTEVNAIRINDAGAYAGTGTSVAGLRIAAITRGSNNYQILLETGVTAPAALADTVGVFVTDIGVGDARLGIVAEGGSPVYLGNNAVRFGANGLIERVSTAGVAANLSYDIPIAAGGAADAVVKHAFQLDSTDRAGLFTETDGAGGDDTAATIWGVPYRDSGAAVAAPNNPAAGNNAVWNGGLRIEAGDDTNRIYFRANEAWHYVNQTAGFEIPEFERFCVSCNQEFRVGERIVGRLNKRLGDGAFHGLWEHAVCTVVAL